MHRAGSPFIRPPARDQEGVQLGAGLGAPPGLCAALERPLIAMPAVLDLPQLPSVQRLLQAEASALRQTWEASDAAALEAEIQKYKAALSDVLEELKRLGGALAFERQCQTDRSWLGGSGRCAEAQGDAGVPWEASWSGPFLCLGRRPCRRRLPADGSGFHVVTAHQWLCPLLPDPSFPFMQASTRGRRRPGMQRGRRVWRVWTGGTVP